MIQALLAKIVIVQKFIGGDGPVLLYHILDLKIVIRERIVVEYNVSFGGFKVVQIFGSGKVFPLGLQGKQRDQHKQEHNCTFHIFHLLY